MCGRDTQRGQREEKIKNQIHGDSCMGGGWQEKRYVWGGGREEKIERKRFGGWVPGDKPCVEETHGVVEGRRK
jgi:hypothetical protein